MAEKLANIALKRYTADNVAIVVVCLGGRSKDLSNSFTKKSAAEKVIKKEKGRRFGFF